MAESQSHLIRRHVKAGDLAVNPPDCHLQQGVQTALGSPVGVTTSTCGVVGVAAATWAGVGVATATYAGAGAPEPPVQGLPQPPGQV